MAQVVGGAGAVAAGVQRMTLASDDPLVVSGGIMDDWDETDRCKVNLISGQAGITGGAGSVASNTPRMTLAADDPLVSKVVSGTLACTQSGTWNVGTLTSVTTVSTLTGSGVAHDAVDSGNPHKIGARATSSLHGLTLVSDADRTDLLAGLDGVQITRPNTNLESIVSGVAAITDGSSTSVISSAGAGVKIYITDVIISNSSSTNVTVDLRDGTGGSVKATFNAPANGGAHKTLSTPLGFTAATAVAADPSASASTVTITLVGFKSKV